jgi:hypothetical protein
MLHLSYAAALKFAQAFAAAEPEPWLLYMRDWEDRLTAESFEPGNRHSHAFLREQLVPYAIVKDWTSRSTAELLEREITRLRGLIQSAIADIERLGDSRASSRLRRALQGA